MTEGGFFLPFFILFAIIFSSIGWHILFKGVGTVDNLWLFLLFLIISFITISSIISYFPYPSLTFFISILLLANFATLYIYSFPRSIWPNPLWFMIIVIADIISCFQFYRFPQNLSTAYFTVSILFLIINYFIVVRKIKHLKSHRTGAVMSYVSAIAIFSTVIVLFSGISNYTYNSTFFLASSAVIIPLSLILFFIFTVFNLNPGSGLNHTSFILLLFFSIPSGFLTVNLLFLRSLLLGYTGPVNFATAAIFILFLIISILGILISLSASTIEGFISRNRYLYQNYVNIFRNDIENITTRPELFSLTESSLKKWFPEIRSIKYLIVNDESADIFSPLEEVFDESRDYEHIIKQQAFLHEPFFSRTSLDLPPEITQFISKYGGNVYIPVPARNELSGFVIIEGKDFSHNALICFSNIINLAISRLEKLSLFLSVIETQKKLEASRHFQETGKMVSFIAHELRSPLSSIMFNMEVIKDNFTRQKEPDPEYLDISLKEIKRLNQTVEKMLTYGRNLKLSPSEGNFSVFFEELSILFLSDSSKIEFIDNTKGMTFHFDWDILKSMFINLINNSIQAIQRNEGTGNVKVTVSFKRKRIIAEIADTGPGIPEEHINSIFEPFYTTRKDGNGLGLATCEKIAKINGGTISLKETSPKGTVFQIILPVE
ncbi:MAG TPA: HAMP domain-containing sensor histidine kinase [bacterium]|nr:HAMP domain-containing sensor histidine kinase [bacterium]HPS28705.1 HAMP domain-containing sensor histidine kinase [bacterium]